MKWHDCHLSFYADKWISRKITGSICKFSQPATKPWYKKQQEKAPYSWLFTNYSQKLLNFDPMLCSTPPQNGFSSPAISTIKDQTLPLSQHTTFFPSNTSFHSNAHRQENTYLILLLINLADCLSSSCVMVTNKFLQQLALSIIMIWDNFMVCTSKSITHH